MVPPLTAREVDSDLREDGVPKFVDKPHTIMVMLVALCCWGYTSFLRNDTASNVRTGLTSATLALLLFATLHFRDSFLWRPHPSVWRFFLGLSLLYAMLLAFMLQNDKDDIRGWLREVDPSLGVRLPEKDYAEACDLYTPGHPGGPFANLFGALQDEFVLAHFLGWYGKALLFRDYSLLWLLSVTFEFIELTFEFAFPNFAECWWDHIILDVLVCNWLGIYLGMKTCKYLGRIEHRETQSLWKTPTLRGKLKRAAVQFTPMEWTTYNWDMNSSAKRFAQVLFLVLCMNITDVNSFFLKFLFWIPPPHPLNTARLIIWLFTAIPATREYYQLITDKQCTRCVATRGDFFVYVFVQLCLFSVRMPLCLQHLATFGGEGGRINQKKKKKKKKKIVSDLPKKKLKMTTNQHTCCHTPIHTHKQPTKQTNKNQTIHPPGLARAAGWPSRYFCRRS
jgi:phosphatidylserine synthase 2